MKKTSKLTEKFGIQKRWVNWTPVIRDGKTTKVPKGKSNDPSTWSLLADLPDQEHIGIMFGLKKMLLGIDIDKCLKDGDVETGPHMFPIIDLLYKANTYTEISPSGTGLHLFLKLTAPLPLKANRKGQFECYTSERYFTVTNNSFGPERDIRTVTPEEAEEILAIIGYPWKQEYTVDPEKFKDMKFATVGASNMTNEEVVKKMFSGRNGATIKALYNGDTSSYGGDDSVADMGLLAHLAFYTQGDPAQMESIWLASPLGSRAKTQQRADYRKRSIENAIANCKEFYKPRKEREKIVTTKTNDDGTTTQQVFDFNSMGLHFTIDKEGNKKYSLIQENINILLEKHPNFAGRFRYDSFLLASQIKMNGAWRPQLDSDELYIQSEISTVVPMFNRVAPLMVQRAITKACKDNTFDSAQDYIKTLTWDGTARIDQWLQTTFGAEDTEYTQKVGSNWLKGLVSRMIWPGCQFDYILVIEGGQGMKKSSAFRELVCDEWHLETERSPGEKDFFVEMAGKAVIELSEGQSNAMIEVKKMKSIITKRKDTYRSPYARVAEDHPRRSVFCMTTNDDEYLKDTTGDRRWWPIESTKMANVAWIKENKDQLFAEAHHRLVKLKETTYEVPEQEAMDKQEERRQKDPNTDAIVEWYMSKCTYYQKKDGITVLDVFIGALCGGTPPPNISMGKPQQMSISSVLKTTLKMKKQRETGGMRLYKYYDMTLKDAPDVMELPIQGKQHKELELAKTLEDIF